MWSVNIYWMMKGKYSVNVCLFFLMSSSLTAFIPDLTWQLLGMWLGEPMGSCLSSQFMCQHSWACSAQRTDLQFMSPLLRLWWLLTLESSFPQLPEMLRRSREGSVPACLYPLRPFSSTSSFWPHAYEKRSHSFLPQAFKFLICARPCRKPSDLRGLIA